VDFLRLATVRDSRILIFRVVATPTKPGSDEGARKEAKMMLEKLLDIEVGEHGTVTEEIELICTMTGFRRRLLVHHIGEGFFRSVDLGPS
jgi:hypothetical protein